MVQRPITDEGLTYQLDQGPLVVDLRTLTDVAAALRAEVEHSLKPQIAQVLHAYSLGASFGLTTESPNVRAARAYYHICLTRMCELLRTYVDINQALASAIDEIVGRYSTTDATLAAKAIDFQRALNKASLPSAPEIALRSDIVVGPRIHDRRYS
jgi:hypothetical protein